MGATKNLYDAIPAVRFNPSAVLRLGLAMVEEKLDGMDKRIDGIERGVSSIEGFLMKRSANTVAFAPDANRIKE